MKILFPTDFSVPAQNAFQHALLLATKSKAEITLLHVIYPVVDAAEIPVFAVRAINDQIETAKELAEIFIDNGKTELGEELTEEPSITTKVVVGAPVSKIRQEVKDIDADLIIMGTQGKHSTLEKIMGSVSTGVIEKANCPVMLVPENAKFKMFHSVVYATDVEEADPFEIWKTSNLLAPLSVIIRVLHVSTGNESDSKQEHFEKLKKYFEDNPLGLQMQFYNLRASNVEEKINEFLYDYDADLLVMYRPGKSFLERIFSKSYTKAMARKTQVPLLVMKDVV